MDMSWTQLSQKGGKTSKLLAFLRLTSCLLCTAFSYLSYGKHNIWQTCPPTTVRFCYTIYIFSFTFPNCQYFSHEKTWKKTTALLVQASLVPALALQGRPAPVHPAHPAAGRCQGAGRGSLAVLESWTFLVFFCQIQAAWWSSHPSEKSESQLGSWHSQLFLESHKNVPNQPTSKKRIHQKESEFLGDSNSMGLCTKDISMGEVFCTSQSDTPWMGPYLDFHNPDSSLKMKHTSTQTNAVLI